MPDDTGEPYRHRQPFDTGREILRRERRQKPFQKIAKKREKPPLFTYRAKDVRRADVFRADRAHVNAAHSADEITERNRADKVSADDPERDAKRIIHLDDPFLYIHTEPCGP